MSQTNSRNRLLVELFTKTLRHRAQKFISCIYQLPFTILLRIFSRGYRSLSIQASPVWTLLWFSSFRSYQHEDHYCTQQTLSALQSVFEDGQQSASRIREWETESPWRKNKEVITTLASTFTFDKPWMWGHSDHGHIVKKYMCEEQNLKNRKANSQEVLRTKTIKQVYWNRCSSTVTKSTRRSTKMLQ